MVKCPVCGSEDVRRSRKKTLLGSIKRWFGLQRYRCRDCSKAFYKPFSPKEGPSADQPEGRRHRTRSERLADHKKKQRRKIELLVFLGMLVIFYAALRVLAHPS